MRFYLMHKSTTKKSNKLTILSTHIKSHHLYYGITN